MVFSSWYEEVLTLANKVGVAELVPRKTSLQRNRSNTPSESPSQHYKREIAIPLIDSLLSQMKERFSDGHGHSKRLLFLILSIITLSDNLNIESIKEAKQSLLFWESDLPFPSSLQNELRQWRTLWQGQLGADIPNTFLLALGSCDSDSFPNIHQLLLISCTLPITSAAERSFSLLRRIKTCLRFTTAEERMSDLGVIAMHYSERISVDDVCLAFTQTHAQRLFQPSLYHSIILSVGYNHHCIT